MCSRTQSVSIGSHYDKLITLLLFMVLMFEWVLKFRIWVLTVMIGTRIYWILVIDGYLFSRVYSMMYLVLVPSFLNSYGARRPGNRLKLYTYSVSQSILL